MADSLQERIEVGRLKQRLEKARGARTQEAPANKSILSAFNRWAGIIGSGFNEGLSNIVGLPVDLLNAGLNALYRTVGLPEVEQPIGGSRTIKMAFRAAGIGVGEEDVPPKTPLERFAQRSMEEIGAAIIPAGAAATAARLGPTVALKARPAFLQPFIQAPGTTAAIETATAAGAGAGAQVGREAFPESPVAEAGGAIGGGLVALTPVGLAGAARRRVGKLVEPLTQAGIERRASRTLQESLSRPPERVISDIDRVVRETAEVGVRPTTAQAAGDPGLLAAERALARKGAEETGVFREIMDEQKRQVRQAMQAAAPEGEPSRVGEALRQQLDTLKVRGDAEIAAAEARISERIAAAGADIDPLEANRIVRAELANTEKSLVARARGMFEAINPNKAIQGSTSRLKAAVKKMQESVRKAERPDTMPEVAGVVNEFEGVEKLDEFMALRSRITDDIRTEAANAAPNRMRISRLQELKDTVDDTIINDLDPTNALDDAGTLYEQARQFFRDNIADKFRRGVVARVQRRGPLGEAGVTPESATVSSFFRAGRGAREAAQDFKRVFSDNATARQALREAVVHDYASFATRPDGTFDVKRANAWLAKHSEALREFPDVERQAKGILQMGDEAAKIRLDVEKSVQRFERSSARFFLDGDPERAVRSILQSRNPGEGLKTLVRQLRGQPEAMNGLRAAFWRNMEAVGAVGQFDEKIVNTFLSPNLMRRFFQENKRFMAQSGLYTPDEVSRIDRIIRAAEVVNRSVISALPGGSDTAQNLQALRGIQALAVRGIFSRFFGRIFGIKPAIIVSPQQVVTQTIGRFIGTASEEQLNALMVRALVDPEVGKTFLMPLTRATEREFTRRMRAHLINLGPVSLKPTMERESPEGGTVAGTNLPSQRTGPPGPGRPSLQR